MIRNAMNLDHGLAALVMLAGSAAAPALAQPLCGPSYFVERGDTLFGIADRCGTTVEALETANPDLDPAALHVGMRVAMPGISDTVRSGSHGRLPVHDAGRMSTLSYMAEITGVPVEELIADDGTLIASETPIGADAEYGSGDEGESVRITGQLTDEGVECPVMRDGDGRLYSLAGDTGSYGAGDRVTVSGTRAEMSFCMQGTTIDVQQITSAE